MAIGVALSLSLSGQDLRYLNHQSWSTEEGLPQSSVHSITQTTDGYLWAATESGLARFDGLRFDVFDTTTSPAFTSSDICCLLADNDNGLWIGTRDGLLHLSHGRFVRFDEANGLPSAEILGFSATSNGELDIATTAGHKQWPNAQLATNSRPPAASPWSWSPQEVHFHTASTDRAWHPSAELPNGRITAFLSDRAGVAWIGMSSGLITIDPATNRIQRVPPFAGTSILSLFQDAEGNHWIGTESSGLHILRQQEFRTVPALDETAITSVTQSGGDMWIGTRDEGLYRARNGIVDQPVPTSQLTSPVILCLQPADGGGIWVGTPDGLNHVSSANQVTHITSAAGLPDDYIRSLAAAPDGSLWIGTRHGLAHLTPSIRGYTVTTTNLGTDLIGAIFFATHGQSNPSDTGTVWVATSNGLARIAGDGSTRTFTTADGLAPSILTALTQDARGRFWAGSQDGTVQLFDGQRFLPVLRIATGSHASTGLQSLIFDPSQSLWIRMKRGIFRMRSAALEACIAHRPCNTSDTNIERFGVAEGLHNDEVASTSNATPSLDASGSLWFPTRSGIAITRDQTSPMHAAPPPVVIQGLSADEIPIDLAHGTPQLPYGNQRISIDFAGLSFIAPSSVQYRYRLNGFDRDWKFVGNRRTATYTNLAPGSYTFEVEARNNDSTWSSQSAQLSFRIIPPIYRRWWFLILASLLIVGLLVALYLLRLRRLRRRFDAVLAERNRMAREIHDTLTQDFVSTSLQLDLIAQQLTRGHTQQALDQVKRARQLVTEGLTEARQSIWELRSNPSQEPLPTRLLHLNQRDVFSELRPTFEVRGAYRVLDPRIEREVLRIASEALTNARQHAAATHTHVVLYYSSEALMLTVTDDGSGFDMNKIPQRDGHYGLVGMKERASSIEGTLDVVSAPDKGTTVTLRVLLSPDMYPSQELR
jgi:signal transduction histidine kinase/ligand-binding sensor domain-containing protein